MRNMDSSGNECKGFISSVIWGRSHMSFVKTRDFLELDFTNSNSNSWRFNNPARVFPPKHLTSQDVIHGVVICIYRGCMKQNVVKKYLERDDRG